MRPFIAFVQLALALGLSHQAYSLGINCRGSSSCTLCAGGAMEELRNDISAGAQSHPGNFYPEGAHIACKGNCCAFFQNGASGKIGDAVPHLDNLVDHGCKICGSDPTTSGNDVSKGELTVNYVSSVGDCAGVCLPPVTD